MFIGTCTLYWYIYTGNCGELKGLEDKARGVGLARIHYMKKGYFFILLYVCIMCLCRFLVSINSAIPEHYNDTKPFIHTLLLY